jgi:hypothetical protein
MIFLGGKTKNNKWRIAIKKEFPYLKFYDPYKKNWTENDKASERKAILQSKFVIFYLPGIISKTEEIPLCIKHKIPYKVFQDFSVLKSFIKKKFLNQKKKAITVVSRHLSSFISGAI